MNSIIFVVVSLISILVVPAIIWILISNSNKNKKDDEQMDEKEALAVITEEEVKVFEDIIVKEVAIKEMLAGLTAQMEDVARENMEAWKTIGAKYELNGGLILDRATREIRRKN